MVFRIPKNLFGKEVHGALERVLERDATVQSEVRESRAEPTPAQNVLDLKKYIFLEGRSHGNYTYQDTLVATERTQGGSNWQGAHDALKQEDARMLTIRQFVDFLGLLRSLRAYDGTGALIHPDEINRVYNEIVEKRESWRSEWLDAKFSKVSVGKTLGIIPKNELHITYHSYDKNGVASEVTEPLGNILMNDRKISSTSLIEHGESDYHGLPLNAIKEGSLNYWHPRDGAVARFVAVSGRAYLDCDRLPSYRNTSFGVRASYAKK